MTKTTEIASLVPPDRFHTETKIPQPPLRAAYANLNEDGSITVHGVQEVSMERESKSELLERLAKAYDCGVESAKKAKMGGRLLAPHADCRTAGLDEFSPCGSVFIHAYRLEGHVDPADAETRKAKP